MRETSDSHRDNAMEQGCHTEYLWLAIGDLGYADECYPSMPAHRQKLSRKLKTGSRNRANVFSACACSAAVQMALLSSALTSLVNVAYPPVNKLHLIRSRHDSRGLESRT